MDRKYTHTTQKHHTTPNAHHATSHCTTPHSRSKEHRQTLEHKLGLTRQLRHTTPHTTSYRTPHHTAPHQTLGSNLILHCFFLFTTSAYALSQQRRQGEGGRKTPTKREWEQITHNIQNTPLTQHIRHHTNTTHKTPHHNTTQHTKQDGRTTQTNTGRPKRRDGEEREEE